MGLKEGIKSHLKAAAAAGRAKEPNLCACVCEATGTDGQGKPCKVVLRASHAQGPAMMAAHCVLAQLTQVRKERAPSCACNHRATAGEPPCDRLPNPTGAHGDGRGRRAAPDGRCRGEAHRDVRSAGTRQRPRLSPWRLAAAILRARRNWLSAAGAFLKQVRQGVNAVVEVFDPTIVEKPAPPDVSA